jgi:hypothetical protein
VTGPITGPVRTCVGCRRRFPLAEGRLVRVAIGQEGTAQIGRTLPGRGAWLCGVDRACLDRAQRTKALHRALRTDPGDLTALRTGFPAPEPDARD